MPPRILAPLLFLGLVCGTVRANDADTSPLDEQTLRAAGLGTDGPALLDFLRKRAQPGVSAEQIAALVRQLGGPEAASRERAAGELVALGPPAVPLLRQAAKDPDDREAAGLALRCLRLLEGSTAAAVPIAAVRLTGLRKPAGAAEVLLAYLPFADDEFVVDEIKVALAAAGVRDGSPDDVLLRALDDPLGLRRAVAVEALALGGGADLLPMLESRLKDPGPLVRFRIALALADLKSARAVAQLIALLGELPPAQARAAEEYLSNLASELAPKVSLGGDDAARKKCQAAWAEWWQKVETTGMLDEFRKRTLTDENRAEALALVRNLGHNDFAVREKASADLIARGTAVVALLRQASSNSDLEVRDRAEKCLYLIQRDKNAQLSATAARLAAVVKPAGAAETLLAFTPFAEDDATLAEVLAALAAVAVRDGKPDPVLVTGLDDAMAVRRASAAAALALTGRADLRPLARRLLQDTDPLVRLRVALALAEGKDRDAVPVLIALLAELPEGPTRQVEEVLYQLAGERAPKVSPGADKESRQKAAAAWSAWWRDHGPGVDLAALTAPQRQLGYTLLMSYDTGQVVEITRDGKTRWQLQGARYPFDARVLSGDRILVAEYSGGRVVERNSRGDVLWEKRIYNPVNCQRLPNGNTFIATLTHLIEVDRGGKEVLNIHRQNGDIMAGQRCRDGQIVFVTNAGQLIRLDASGKEMKSFNVTYIPYGGLEVLPNGRVLVAQLNNNKVVEFDADGKSVWEASFQQPTSAVRLPGGNTLVASQQMMTVAELDRTGKVVWEHKSALRPWKARRR